MDRLIGKTINKYLIIKQIGKGNFGTVFLSYNRIKKHLYALKIFEEENEDNYIHETKLLFKLSKIKNVIHIIENFKYNDYYIIVEELMLCSLDYLLQTYYKNGLPINVINKIKSLTTTIKEIHNKDILHGDIKPDNIFIKGLSFDNKNLLNKLNNMNTKQFNKYSLNLFNSKNIIPNDTNLKKNISNIDDNYINDDDDYNEDEDENYDINTQSDISSNHNNEEIDNFVLENLLDIIFDDENNENNENNKNNDDKDENDKLEKELKIIKEEYKEENLLKYDYVLGDFDNSFIISETDFNDVKDFQTRYYRDINIILRGNITPDCDLYAFNETLYELQNGKVRINPHKSFGITSDKDNIKLLLENGLIITNELKSRKYHLFFDNNDLFLYNDYLTIK